MENLGLEGVWELLEATLRRKIFQKLSWLILVNFGRARIDHFLAQMGQDGANLEPRWRQEPPRWAQDGHLRSQNDQLETILGGILPTFWDLGCEKPNSKKHAKTLRFFAVFGVLEGALGIHSGSSWRNVGLCWASWAPSWSNLATR